MNKSGNEVLDLLIDELNELNLPNMAAALEVAYHSDTFLDMDRMMLFSQVIDAEYQVKISSRFQKRLQNAHLKGCPQELTLCHDSSVRQYLPTGCVDILSSLKFISDGLNICILGPSDSGKSYLAKAIAIKACIHYRVFYHHFEEFMAEMSDLRETNYKRYQKKIRSNVSADLIVLDDFLLHSVTDERFIKILFEILEKRSELGKSTIICSQREPNSWKTMIMNDEVAANAVVKRATKHYTVVINKLDEVPKKSAS